MQANGEVVFAQGDLQEQRVLTLALCHSVILKRQAVGKRFNSKDYL
jgi:hypothetical protein